MPRAEGGVEEIAESVQNNLCLAQICSFEMISLGAMKTGRQTPMPFLVNVHVQTKMLPRLAWDQPARLDSRLYLNVGKLAMSSDFPPHSVVL